MKKILFLVVIFVLALGVGCKKKVEPLPQPQETKVEKISIEDFMVNKGLSSTISNLEPGQVVTVKIDTSKVLFGETELYVSKFPLAFRIPEDEASFVKYMEIYAFPAVVWRLISTHLGEEDSQLEVLYLNYFLERKENGDLMWILKESPAGTPPFENIPTVLVEYSGGKFIILNQKNKEMPRWDSYKK